MEDFETNLSPAWEAVRFVKGKMRFGAKNKIKDLWRSKGQSSDALADLRSDEDQYFATLKSRLDNSEISLRTATERLIEFRAAAAAAYGAGNCAEQAALAFVYLRDRGIFPLDYMFKPDWVPFLSLGGHAFVVIGRSKGSDPAKPSTWGRLAVIADPHETETAYPASKIDQYMPNTKFVSMFRQDSKTNSAIRVMF
jgi:hypothetical protein